MKKLILLVLVAFISIATFADSKKPVSGVKSELRIEIVKLLGKVNFQINEDIDSVVEFMVNNRGEIIVLTVQSNNTLVDSYVKNKLNYNIVTTKADIKGKRFTIPLKIIKKNS